MKKSINRFIIILVPLIDLFSTYLLFSEPNASLHEMHFVVQMFGGNLTTLYIFFAIEILSLLILYNIFLNYKPQKTHQYKLLKQKLRTNRTIITFKVKAALPVFIYIVLFVHFMAIINNSMLYFYISKSPSAPPLVNKYVEIFHISGKFYLFYILLLSLVFLWFLLNWKKIKSKYT